MTQSSDHQAVDGQSDATDDLQVVFLCGARDFHAMDWYRATMKTISKPQPIILTDLIEGEGFKKLISSDDIVCRLVILDEMLFRYQSHLGNIWRNILKAVLFPLQVILVRRFNKKYKNALYYAHSMYYIWLAWASRVRFVGTPQGSDILIKPNKSVLFRALSVVSMKAAKLITVDSRKMADGIERLTGKRPVVVQNGIDIKAIGECQNANMEGDPNRKYIVSFRGFTPLYRIDRIVRSRNESSLSKGIPLVFIYPFYEKEYMVKAEELFNENDMKMGRLPRYEFYKILLSTSLAISIPISDSSPRSVYEAIFCGAIVAITWQPYFNDLPECMKERIILVNMEDPSWFDNAIGYASRMVCKPFLPTRDALENYDQEMSFANVHKMAIRSLCTGIYSGALEDR